MFKKNLFSATALILFLALVSSPAHAAFSYKEKLPEPITPATDLKLADGEIILAQIGPSTTDRKQSKGDEVMLPLAIELISPHGWKPIVEDELQGRKVSWQSDADGDWVKTLEEIGEEENLRFVINWKSREIATGKSEIDALVQKTKIDEIIEESVADDGELIAAVTPQTAAPQTMEKKSHVTNLVAQAVKDAGRVPEASIVTVAEMPWELEPGSLKEQLAEWADRAGYNLIWDNEYDYRLDAGEAFYGDFERAVSEVITALYRNGARIKADIYTKNKVLYVSGGPER